MAGLVEMAAAYAEWLSLVLIIGSFLIVAFLAYRVRTIRSFQFEMFFVLLVITVSEVPAILNSIGIINASNFETAGLTVHSLAMVFLAAFVVLRAAKYFRR